jgi:hypothetical protein
MGGVGFVFIFIRDFTWIHENKMAHENFIALQFFYCRVSARENKPAPQMIQGVLSPSTWVFLDKFCSGTENWITLVTLEAELIILRCLKLIRGLFIALKFISGGNPVLSLHVAVYKTKYKTMTFPDRGIPLKM